MSNIDTITPAPAVVVLVNVELDLYTMVVYCLCIHINNLDKLHTSARTFRAILSAFQEKKYRNNPVADLRP